MKSHGETARDVMTREVITDGPDMLIKDIADLMETRHIKRVPVVEGDEVVGNR